MKAHMTDISEHLRRRIRCIIWKQWKIPSKRIPALVKLGANIEQAKAIAFSRKKLLEYIDVYQHLYNK